MGGGGGGSTSVECLFSIPPLPSGAAVNVKESTEYCKNTLYLSMAGAKSGDRMPHCRGAS